MPKRNDPYSRPINATKPEGQMLQGEYYGEKATDKVLHGATGGRVVHQVRPMASVVPAWPEAKPVEKPKAKATRSKKATTPSPEATSPTTDVTSPSNANAGGITESDLFG